MEHRISKVFKEVTGASIGWAVVMILLGLLAVILPLATRIAVSVIVAWIVLLSGLAYVVSAVADRNAGAFIWRLLIGLVYITGGSYLAFHPQIALETLALLVGVIFTIESILEFVTFFQFRVYAGSVWALFDGLATLLMAFLIVFPWPNSSSWVIGIILGINLMTTGFAVLIYSLAARKTLDLLS
jgi:uncharacterized membrane protein HdeD (DUF308 family)